MVYKSRYHLENKKISVSIDSLTGQLLELVDVESGDNLLKNHLFAWPQPLAVLSGESVLRPADGEIIRRHPRLRPRITMEESSARVEYPALWDGQRAWPVRAGWTMELCRDTARIIWRLRLSFEDGEMNQTLDLVRFPCLNGIYWGDTWTDNTLVYPHYAGLMVKDPVSSFAADSPKICWRWQDYSYTYSMGSMAAGLPGGSFGLNDSYTGALSMKWLDYYGDYEGGRGLYFACMDPQRRVCSLRAETFGPKSPGMCFSFEHPLRMEPGDGGWESPPVELWLHSGGWRQGADRYSQQFERLMGAEEPARPAWFEKSPGLVAHYDFKYQNGGIVHRYSSIPKLYEECRDMGLDHMLFAGWHQDGFDNGFPEYRPDPELGSPGELCEAVEQVESQGGHISLYMNVRIINSLYRHLDGFAAENGVKKPSGELMKERAGRLDFIVQCAGSQGWREKLTNMAGEVFRDTGVKSLYLDQLAMGEPGRCVNPNHDHGEKGVDKWNCYYAELLSELLQRHPDAALLIEGCSDSYGGLCAGQLVSSFAYHHCGAFPGLYRYTFPRQTLIDMVYPGINLAMRPVHVARASRELMDRAFVLGMYFWIYDLDWDNTFMRDPQGLEHLKELISLRRFWLERFGAGTFRDTEGIAAAKGLTLASYRLEDGYLVAWTGKEQGEHWLLLDRQPKSAAAFGPGGVEVTVELEGRRIELGRGPGILKLSF